MFESEPVNPAGAATPGTHEAPAQERQVVLPHRPVQVDLPWEEAAGELGATEGVSPSDGAETEAPPKARRDYWGWLQDPVVKSTTEVFIWGAVLAAAVGLVVFFRPMMTSAGEIRSQAIRVAIEWPPLAGETSAQANQVGGVGRNGSAGGPRTWVNQETRELLESLVQRSMSASPTDPEAPRRVRAALIRTGWFTEALRVERTADGLVRVFGAAPERNGALGAAPPMPLWRVPVAAVRYAGKDHLVAGGGERLPLAYAPGESGMNVIVGVSHEQPDWGEAWLGGEVQAAIELYRMLQLSANFQPGAPGLRQIGAVDVSEYDKSKRLTIVTERGNRVLWGGPVGQLNPGEVRDRTKLDRLAGLLRDHGRIDAGHELVDLRIEGNVFVQDRTASTARPAEPEPPTKGKKGQGSGRSGSRQRAAADRR